jgi:glycosyltransferase involved in cell wall biosynthesis
MFIIHDNDIRSGATASLLDLLKNFELKNHSKIAIISNVGDSVEIEGVLENYGIESYKYKIPMTRFFFKSSLIMKMLSLIYSIYNILQSYIVSTKIIRDIKNIDLIYSNTTATYLGLFLSIKIPNSKHIFHIREFGREDQNMDQVLGDTFFYSLVDKYSDEIIVISKALKSKVLGHIDNRKLKLVYDDVKVNELETKQRLNPINLLLTGTLCEGKGQKFVIEAIGYGINNGLLSRDIKVAFAGDDNNQYASQLKKMVEKLGLSQIVLFHGFCSDMDEVRCKYAISVIASSSEAFGRVTIEAMNASHLVIASNQGANMELIDDKINGLIYKHNSVESFISVIQYIVEDEVRAKNMAIKGYSHSKTFTSNNAAKKIEQLIELNLA